MNYMDKKYGKDKKKPKEKTPLGLLTLSYKRARAIRHFQKINKVKVKP